MTVRFASPDNLWLLLALAPLALFSIWSVAAKRRALRRFVSAATAPRLTETASPQRQYWKYALFVVGMAFLIAALSGPQFGAELAMAHRRGVDVVVALDVSRSMLAEDLKPNRLQRAKYHVGELVDRLQGDRVGLVVFAGKAFVQCPLTLDYGAFRLLLSSVDAGSIPVQGTAIGDAVATATRCFEVGDRQHKVVILFTDGEDHIADPVEQAERSAAEGVRIFTVGIGTPEGELIPVRDAERVDYHRDAEGHPVKTRLDERTLRDMAHASRAGYYRSSLSGSEIGVIADEIANMDQKEFDSERFNRYQERYQIPLGLAFICFAVGGFLSDGSRRRQRQWKGRFA
jgi:Ca-activated chloride channel family protein